MIVGSSGANHGGSGSSYDRVDAQILVWPKGNDKPDWTKIKDVKQRDEAIRQEAEAWWNRAQLQAAMPA